MQPNYEARVTGSRKQTGLEEHWAANSENEVFDNLKESKAELLNSGTDEFGCGSFNIAGDAQMQLEKLGISDVTCNNHLNSRYIDDIGIVLETNLGTSSNVVEGQCEVLKSSGDATVEELKFPTAKVETMQHVIPKADTLKSSRYDKFNTQPAIAEVQAFFNSMKHKSSARLKALEQDFELHSGINKQESKNQRKGKRRRRLSKVRRTLNTLDCNITKKWNCHASRNMLLGPNARFFTLSAEEESLLEDLLSQPDTLELNSECGSMSSDVSTAFEIDGEDALQLIEIDEKLEQLKKKHSASSSPQALSVSSLTSRGNSAFGRSNELNTPSNQSSSFEFTGSSKVLYQSLIPLATTTPIDDYLIDLRERRRFETKSEEIDRKLRLLLTVNGCSKLSEEEMTKLIVECKLEHDIYGVQHFCST